MLWGNLQKDSINIITNMLQKIPKNFKTSNNKSYRLIRRGQPSINHKVLYNKYSLQKINHRSFHRKISIISSQVPFYKMLFGLALKFPWMIIPLTMAIPIQSQARLLHSKRMWSRDFRISRRETQSTRKRKKKRSGSFKSNRICRLLLCLN